MSQFKTSLLMFPLFVLTVLPTACSVVSPASDNPFVLVEAEAITSPDTAMVIGATRPDTGEQAGEIRWEVLEYRIVLRNESDATLTELETRIVPSDAIMELYEGNDPFAESSGLRSHYGKWPEAFDVTPGEEVEIKRGIITYAHETDVARNVGSPLTREEADRLLAIADQVTLEVQWDGGSQRFDLAELGMKISKEEGTPSPTTEESSPTASTVTNVSDQPVHIEFGACALSLRVYDNPDRSGGPVAQGGQAGICFGYLAFTDLEPGESISPKEFRLSVPVADILGDILPEGHDYFTPVVEANNHFAFDLLAELRRQEGDQNRFFSPLSISLALAMTYNGAAGETQQAMAEALHLAGLDRDAVNQGNAALLAAMAERVQERAREATREKDKLAHQRSLAKQKMQSLLDLYLDGQVSRDDYSEKKAGLEEKIQELDGLIEEVSREIPQVDAERVNQSVDHFLNEARGVLGEFGPEKTQLFLRYLFDEMTYDWKEGVVRLRGHIPTGALPNSYR